MTTAAYVRIVDARTRYVSSHDAAHKPYAVQRAKKHGGRSGAIASLTRWMTEYRAATRVSDLASIAAIVADYRARLKSGQPIHAYIQRPGRYFYCQHCGRRMTATATVYAKTTKTTEEPREICCIECATARGYTVVTSQNWSSAAYAQATHVQ